jgi:hypothetical protein
VLLQAPAQGISITLPWIDERKGSRTVPKLVRRIRADAPVVPVASDT